MKELAIHDYNDNDVGHCAVLAANVYKRPHSRTSIPEVKTLKREPSAEEQKVNGYTFEHLRKLISDRPKAPRDQPRLRE